jgi:hypothetical protein
MLRSIPGHVDQFSVHQLVVVREGIGKLLELFNGDSRFYRHDAIITPYRTCSDQFSSTDLIF